MKHRPTRTTRPRRLARLSLALALGWAAAAAQAQSSVTLYGTLDQYFSVMRSSSGTSITALLEGKDLRSRFGMRGTEDLGDGLYARFNLEMGFSTNTGGPADTTRGFDRQTWVGLGTQGAGELRLGRQNTVILTRGDYIDYTGRSLGSMVSNFGLPSRFDNDIAYLSPRVGGLMLEAHYAHQSASASSPELATPVLQLAADYLNGPFRAGYAGVSARAPGGSALNATVVYHNLFGNYDYGRGKVYLVYIRSNNMTATANGNDTGQALNNTGGAVSWPAGSVNRMFNINQVSGDYMLTPQLRVGALWGWIKDTSGSGQNANGGSVGAYYALSKRTSLSVLWETLHNSPNAGFRPFGSASVSSNFSGGDVNGRSISGVQVGILHRF